MEQKSFYSKLALCAIKGIQEMEECVTHSGVDRPLLELVKLRASQIRECKYCKELHIDDAREKGESLDRLLVLEDWRENHYFTEREKAALAWTEAMTFVPNHVDLDQLVEEVGSHFTEQELISITVAVNVVNSWNNLSLSMRAVYESEE